MTRVVSEDAVRRGLDKIEAEAGARWLTGHLDETVRPLLTEPWILDVDTTVKPLYDRVPGSGVARRGHRGLRHWAGTVSLPGLAG